MQYKPLKQSDRIEKAIILTNKIIVKALQSNRGDSIRAMNDADLKKMICSVFHAVDNILAGEPPRGYDYKGPYEIEDGHNGLDPTERFKPRPDVEIEEEVTAYFEINGKLQYREVLPGFIIALAGIDEPVECLMLAMKMGVQGMRYNPFSVSDRLERADILTNADIMFALRDELDERGDVIREMSYAKFKRWRKDKFSFYYHELYAEAADGFEQACEDYVPERDGIENDPRKNFKPKTEFEIDQELRAYFEEQDKRFVNRNNQ